MPWQTMSGNIARMHMESPGVALGMENGPMGEESQETFIEATPPQQRKADRTEIS
jgi:hypothetical protein